MAETGLCHLCPHESPSPSTPRINHPPWDGEEEIANEEEKEVGH